MTEATDVDIDASISRMSGRAAREVEQLIASQNVFWQFNKRQQEIEPGCSEID